MEESKVANNFRFREKHEYRLIDVLNMMAKGEIPNGTQLVFRKPMSNNDFYDLEDPDYIYTYYDSDAFADGLGIVRKILMRQSTLLSYVLLLKPQILTDKETTEDKLNRIEEVIDKWYDKDTDEFLDMYSNKENIENTLLEISKILEE